MRLSLFSRYVSIYTLAAVAVLSGTAVAYGWHALHTVPLGSDVQLSAPADSQREVQLQHMMDAIQTALLSTNGVHMSLPVGSVQPVAENTALAVVAVATVSAIAWAPQDAAAIVNGQMVHQGDRLNDIGTVLEINRDNVVVRDGQVRRTLKLTRSTP
ncbi:hypothetical protein ACS0Y3_16900 [Burkholderia gladioli]|uniref:hypothetical protein n=1 Tax=Burkholderia gladioli TaxID=28095 RepID=UPI003F78C359